MRYFLLPLLALSFAAAQAETQPLDASNYVEWMVSQLDTIAAALATGP